LLGNCCLEINMCTNEEVPWVMIEKRQEKITSIILWFFGHEGMIGNFQLLGNYIFLGINIIFYGV
jgi:hypothetical protein